MTENEFITSLNDLNIKITGIQLKQLNRYYELLVEWNEKMNLTGITEKKEVYLKHFYDSLCIQKVINLYEESTLCDMGTGAGFPGLVLKILFPNLKVYLIDSLNKRIIFLDNVIEELQLDDVITVHSRIEDYAKKHREEYDIVTARAVSKLNILLEYAIPMVKVGKYFIPLKAHVTDEIEKSNGAFKKLDCNLIKTESFLLPIEGSQRNILLIKKNEITNKKYPRNNNEIRKKSL